MAMLAQKPPMGWNCWNHFCYNTNEEIILATADRMVSDGYLDAGYNIVSIDDLWMLRERDENGDFVPDPVKYPHGMKFIGDYLHERGLKFGMYANAGTRTYAGGAGSYGYERQDARKFAEYGVDLVKYDFGYPAPGIDPKKMYRRMGQALRETGRDIIFSACMGRKDVTEWMRSCGAHMWRIKGDIMDSWESIKGGSLTALGLEAFAGPGGWNDPDMLVVGVNGKGWVGGFGGGCELEDYKTHFAIWCVLASPLLMGHNLMDTTDEIREILLNKELIAINQDDAGIQGFRLAEGVDIIVKPLYGGDIAFCLPNFADDPKDISLAWDMCGWDPDDKISLRDVTTHEELGVYKAGIAYRVAPHGCAVLRAKRL